MPAAVVIEGVDKRFGDVHALRALSARIHYGRLTGLVGPDGAGKTTLMRILTGLLVPDAGRATVAGHDVVRDNDVIHAMTGYMPQRFGLYEDLSVMENMRLYARLRGMDVDAHTGLFAELLEFTRLAPFTRRLAGRLSGGMKQKLGLACALMARPAVLLLDEPSVGVDPVSRQDLWRMVQALTDDGMAVVWSTAYLDEAERCDDVLLLNDGQFAFDGPPEALTDRLRGRSFASKMSATSAEPYWHRRWIWTAWVMASSRARACAWCCAPVRTTPRSGCSPIRSGHDWCPCHRASKTPSSTFSAVVPAAPRRSPSVSRRSISPRTLPCRAATSPGDSEISSPPRM